MASARVVNTIPLWRRGSARPLRPRGCGGARSRRQGDELSTAARRSLLVAIVALHGLVLYGLTQIDAERESARVAAPIFATLILPPAAPPADEPAAPPAASPPPRPRLPASARSTPPVVSVSPAPAAAPTAFVAPAAPVDAAPMVEDPLAAQSGTGAAGLPRYASPPGAAVAPAPPPRTLNASEVGYLEPPRVSYPSLSRRLGEQGRTLPRVRVDANGQPAEVLVASSSGFTRLDEAAVAAARRVRFRPYIEDGAPRELWVLMPFVFTLEESS